MHLGKTEILDTFAEAFGARYTRLIIAAEDDDWLDTALRSITGYGTSVIGCDAEVGVEQRLPGEEWPDGRPSAAVLLFAFTMESLAQAAQHRVGQSILTCPTTACFNGLYYADEKVSLGKYLRYFGDGFETFDEYHGRGCWRIPVMDGEFVVEAMIGIAKGVAGGNIIIQGASRPAALAAAARGAAAVGKLPGVITPFPGGVCRSGSKVGSKYKALVASTAEAYCPTLRDRVESKLVVGADCAYEIVIDGVEEPAVAAEMLAAI
jgi:formylmethanofuran--tetrahydromethanopterin N-formyltransferase